MKSIISKIGCMLLFLLLVGSVSSIAAEGPPQLPMLLYGKVSNGTEPAPSGTAVIAKVDGEVVNQAEVDSDGWYGVPGSNRLIIPECDSFDLVVSANGKEYLVVEDYDWEPSVSGSERIDLDYSSATIITTPTPSPTPPGPTPSPTPPGPTPGPTATPSPSPTTTPSPTPTPTPEPTATPSPTPPANQTGAAPSIVSWSNTYTEDDTLDLTVERLSIVEFNVTANQSVNWDWTNAMQLSGDGESQATAIRGFPHAGLVEVSVWGSNSNGSTQELQWNFTVEDTTPPASVTNLTSVSTESTVNWTWINPADGDFSHLMVYINGEWIENTSEDYYLATNLTSQTSYNISTHTVDSYGNINHTWVNHTAKTETVTTPTPKPSRGGGGGGGGAILFTPAPEPTPTPTETKESGVQAGVGSTSPPTPTPTPKEETPTVKETTTETPAPSTKDQKILPWWQQPTGYIGLIALTLGAIVIIVYMARRQP